MNAHYTYSTKCRISSGRSFRSGSIPLSPQHLLLIGFTISMFAFIGIIQTSMENHRLDVWIAQSTAEYQAELEKHTLLEEHVKYATSPNYHLKKAKNMLNMMEEGEVIIEIQGVSPSTVDSRLADTSTLLREEQRKKQEEIDKMPNWMKWYHFFFGEVSYVVRDKPTS